MAPRPILNFCLSSTRTAAAATAAAERVNIRLNCSNRLYLGVIFAAAVGVEEEGRFNFSRSADYPQLQPGAKKKL